MRAIDTTVDLTYSSQCSCMLEEPLNHMTSTDIVISINNSHCHHRPSRNIIGAMNDRWDALRPFSDLHLTHWACISYTREVTLPFLGDPLRVKSV